MNTLTPGALATLDRITDRTPDDLAEIKELLALATGAILDNRNTMAYDWVGQATDLLNLVAQRLGYTRRSAGQGGSLNQGLPE